MKKRFVLTTIIFVILLITETVLVQFWLQNRNRQTQTQIQTQNSKIQNPIQIQNQNENQSLNTQLILENWDNNAGYISNLIIQGKISEVKLNSNVTWFGSYHIFPAIITVEITNLVRISEKSKDQADISPQYREFNWGTITSIIVAYDRLDVPNLIKGQLVETKGCYYNGFLSTYRFKLVIEPTITDSYLKLL